jgi:hypothetical protein
VGFPWLFALPPMAAVLAFLWTSRGHLRATLTGRAGTSRWRYLYLGIAVYLLLFEVLVANWDPIAKGSAYAPGAGIQASAGGSIYCLDLGNPCSMSGPLYRIKVEPGQKFSVLTSIVNKGPFPITLLGPLHLTTDASTPGVDWFLAEIWSAPGANSGVFPDESVLQPFRPVTLGAGQQAAFVLVLEGGACADPNGVEDRGTDLSYTITGFNFLYEFAFWRRQSYFFPQFEISVPVDKSCMAEPAGSASP